MGPRKSLFFECSRRNPLHCPPKGTKTSGRTFCPQPETQPRQDPDIAGPFDTQAPHKRNDNMIGKSALSSALVLAFAGMAQAEIYSWTAALNTAQAVSPAQVVEGAGGSAEGTVDTDSGRLDFTISHSGMSGDLTAAHFHGPAAVGENAAPAVDLNGDGGLSSPIVGYAIIPAAQIAQLRAGLWYLNLHTALNPDGEIRGQVEFTQ
jgi:hypothetical protein